ncbi:PREDICTED: trafficking protein particle complex subunit 1-like [Priapulus caudatus]|uniref:Trafficking protein particle complex subunit n=1 Tax=Priapulus caudatus TaxID=37621 RepID=A0ABM1E421_PRICU|nr:PREDICTED: trafficking protein particle complex subunit 1-like [Priapulus caudatus]
MVVYNFYLFDRNGTCLHYAEWSRHRKAGMADDEEYKLLYGICCSCIKSFINRYLSRPAISKDGFLCYSTSKYKLHFYETPSGLKFVMNTDQSIPGNIRDVLHQLYSQIYVEYVVKNPMCALGEPITSELFKSKLDEFVRSLPIFNAKPA